MAEPLKHGEDFNVYVSTHVARHPINAETLFEVVVNGPCGDYTWAFMPTDRQANDEADRLRAMLVHSFTTDPMPKGTR